MNMAAAIQERLKGLFPEKLGIRIVEAEHERVVAEMEVNDDLCTVPGVVHGGAIMSLADTAGAVGTVLNLPGGARTTTIESKTNFLGAARSGTAVRAECEPLHRGRQTMVWQTRVFSGEKLVAIVTQTQAVLADGATQAPEEMIAALFGGKSVREQKELLAKLERGGAAVYRALAAQEEDEAAKADLLACAQREEDNAEQLEGQVATGQ